MELILIAPLICIIGVLLLGVIARCIAALFGGKRRSAVAMLVGGIYNIVTSPIAAASALLELTLIAAPLWLYLFVFVLWVICVVAGASEIAEGITEIRRSIPDTKSSFCRFCGAPIQEHDLFCGQCGKQLE